MSGVYRTSGVDGDVEVDGYRRDPRSFRKMSAYITQKDHLLLHLSVDEYLNVAAQLKLGNAVSPAEKSATVMLITEYCDL